MVTRLPILITTHRRPEYLKLALNSLFYNLPNPEEKICIVASDPDQPTKDILTKLKDSDSRVRVVTTESNLGYAVGNFGIKWFNLLRFIHFEDDFILPSHTNYLYPQWTLQMATLMETYDVVALQTSVENAPVGVLQRHYPQDKFLQRQSNTALWHYYDLAPGDRPPIGGNGLAIDSLKLYGYPPLPPRYCQTDCGYLERSRTFAMSNLRVYHMGANQMMDQLGRKEYTNHKEIPCAPPLVEGTDLHTGQKRIIDLTTGYSV